MSTEPNTEQRAVLDELTDLAEAASMLNRAAVIAGMPKTAHDAHHIGVQVRAARTRLNANENYLNAAEAMRDTALGHLAYIAVRIGDAIGYTIKGNPNAED